MKGVAVGLIGVALLATAASADILAWDDADGVRHYTNLKGEVSSQQVVQVVVDEQVWRPEDSPVPVVQEDPVAQAQPVPPRDTVDEVLRAYLAGLASGQASNAGTGGSVYINGPLAVTTAAPMPYPYGGYGLPGYDWFLPGSYPFLATSVIGHRGPIRRRFGNGFRGRLPASQRFFNLAGPPLFGAAGPPPFGAAGPAPFGAAGPAPFGAAGPAPQRIAVGPFRR